ncbi:MAG TPA: hypothetical protein VMS93_12905 [Candidatus Saccharimonadales bacterium]|nr:hypothetical protein [Candidatus Saccharimonadales bacterium]
MGKGDLLFAPNSGNSLKLANYLELRLDVSDEQPLECEFTLEGYNYLSADAKCVYKHSVSIEYRQGKPHPDEVEDKSKNLHYIRMRFPKIEKDPYLRLRCEGAGIPESCIIFQGYKLSRLKEDLVRG